jgi:UDP-glucose 6-dehydrogenase
MGAVAAYLSYRLEHDDPGHKRHAWHVASNPKLLVRDVFVTDARNPNRVLIDNCRQLFHFETLRIVFSYLLDVRDNVVEVDRIWIDDEVFSDHRRTPIYPTRAVTSGSLKAL